MNMAIDEVMLYRWPGTPVLLRLYSWTPPGLSLGYFQRYGRMEGEDAVRECGAVVTRRITGGDAILHFEELTFSLVGEEGTFPFNGPVKSSYHRIHDAVALGLEELGISAQMRKPPAPAKKSDTARGENGRCFYNVTGYDLVCGSLKIVGSAQRRVGGKVLHHGSIPLARNPLTPEAADLSGLAGRSITGTEAAEAVRSGFEKAFGLHFEQWKPDASYVDDYKKFADGKYASQQWIKRR